MARALLIVLLALSWACGSSRSCSQKGPVGCEGSNIMWCNGQEIRIYCSCAAGGGGCEGNVFEGYWCGGATPSCPCPGDGCG